MLATCGNFAGLQGALKDCRAWEVEEKEPHGFQLCVCPDVVHVSLGSNVHGDSHASTLMIYLANLEVLEVALSGEDTVRLSFRLNVMDKDLKSVGFSCTMLLTSSSPC